MMGDFPPKAPARSATTAGVFPCRQRCRNLVGCGRLRTPNHAQPTARRTRRDQTTTADDNKRQSAHSGKTRTPKGAKHLQDFSTNRQVLLL